MVDIVLPKYRTVVFVHGCYWHRHVGCKYAYTPKSRVEFWETKFSQNVKRDVQVRSELETLGWNIVIVWECELRDSEALVERLRRICVVASE